MTLLLVVAALLTAAVIGFAVYVTLQVATARRNLQVEREVRRRLRPQPVEVVETNDAADCAQAWLDSRWTEHYG